MSRDQDTRPSKQSAVAIDIPTPPPESKLNYAQNSSAIRITFAVYRLTVIAEYGITNKSAFQNTTYFATLLSTLHIPTSPTGPSFGGA